jgi:hypothetical protein
MQVMFRFLIDDRINRNRGLSRLAVANNQFTLPRPTGTIESIAFSPSGWFTD